MITRIRPISPLIRTPEKKSPVQFGSTKYERWLYNTEDKIKGLNLSPRANTFYSDPQLGQDMETRRQAEEARDSTAQVLAARDRRHTRAQSTLDALITKTDGYTPEAGFEAPPQQHFNRIEAAARRVAFTDRKVGNTERLYPLREQRLREAETLIASRGRTRQDEQAKRERNQLWTIYENSAAQRERHYQSGLTQAEIEKKERLELHARELDSKLQTYVREQNENYEKLKLSYEHEKQMGIRVSEYTKKLAELDQLYRTVIKDVASKLNETKGAVGDLEAKEKQLADLPEIPQHEPDSLEARMQALGVGSSQARKPEQYFWR